MTASNQALMRANARRKLRLSEDVDRVLPRWLAPIVIAVLLILIVVPVGYMVVLSIAPNQSVALNSFNVGNLGIANYIAMWNDAPLAQGLGNTILIAGVAALASVVFGLLAAYALARFAFRGRRPFLYTLLASQTVPGTTLVLPLFAVLSFIQIQLDTTFIGTYWPIMVTYMTFGLPLSTWFIFSYLQTIPQELEQAALVDGCSRLGALFRIILPISAPAIAVAFVFSFLIGWNDVLFASVFTNGGTQTLSIVVERLASTQSGEGLPLYGEFMAAAVVSSIPVVVLYLFFQRFLVQGLSAGSMSGV